MNWFLKEQSTTTKSLATIALLALIVGGAFMVGVQVGSEDENSTAPASFLFAGGDALEPVGVDFSPVWKAWNSINSKFVPVSTSTEIADADKVWGMISGLARSLEDPYTVFLPPADSEIFEDDISGNFEGVGMEIGIRNNTLTVIAPLKGTPADKAGIMSGDSILRIDGESTDGLSIDKAVKRIRGEGGTPVTFTIAREGEGEFLEIEVIRAVIEIPTIETTLRDDGIFVIQLFNFSALSPNAFRQALREFVLTGSNRLILDLRGNPGGFLEAAVDMASWFLPTGEVVLREDFGGDVKPNIHRSKGYDIFNENLEMVILINRGSASASEILAGALKEHGIATLVGENSFGKGSVQELVKITPDTSLKITIARWLTPNSISISDGGLTPDIEVLVAPEDFEAGVDAQLNKAVDVLLSN